MDKQLARLAKCEAVIERSLQTFVGVGEALREIRESTLYVQHYSSFEDYCQRRWGFVRRQADRLIAAAEVAELVRPIGLTSFPANEWLARELVPLKADPDRLRATVEALGTLAATPTAAQVRGVVQTVKAAPLDAPLAIVLKEAIAKHHQPPEKTDRRLPSSESDALPRAEPRDLELQRFFDALAVLGDLPSPEELSLRVPPDYDEQLKPIENAIRYLMSFHRLCRQQRQNALT